jgi:hypothetical protein
MIYRVKELYFADLHEQSAANETTEELKCSSRRSAHLQLTVEGYRLSFICIPLALWNIERGMQMKTKEARE